MSESGFFTNNQNPDLGFLSRTRRNCSRHDEIRLWPNFVVQGRGDSIVTAMFPLQHYRW